MELKQWQRYFRANAKNTLVPSNPGKLLTLEEKNRITRSIQDFQIGEASEGRYLKAAARAFAAKTGIEGYLECVEHLIREENRHSAYLGSFMRAQSIPAIKSSWTDSAFRLIRRAFGLELNIRTLVTAEIIALTFYECLAAATTSSELASICDRMQKEEKMHIEFQMWMIHSINYQKLPPLAALADISHALLLAGTLLAVWCQHQRVLKTQYSLGSFCRTVWRNYAEFMNKGMLAAGYKPEVSHA